MGPRRVTTVAPILMPLSAGTVGASAFAFFGTLPPSSTAARFPRDFSDSMVGEASSPLLDPPSAPAEVSADPPEVLPAPPVSSELSELPKSIKWEDRASTARGCRVLGGTEKYAARFCKIKTPTSETKGWGIKKADHQGLSRYQRQRLRCTVRHHPDARRAARL